MAKRSPSVVLEPPDPKQCQAEKPNGVTFMTLGGRFKLIRCTNVPEVVVTEEEPQADGQRGAMSLCGSCLAVMRRQDKRKVRVESVLVWLERDEHGGLGG